MSPQMSVTVRVLLFVMSSLSWGWSADACSCNMPSLRSSLCRSKYSAIVQVMKENGEPAVVDGHGVQGRLVPALMSSHETLTSSRKAQGKPLMMRKEDDGHEHEEGGEVGVNGGVGNDANSKGHRMTVVSVISTSQEGERALKSQLMWTRLPSRTSSCTPAIRPGHKYLMFGDVAPDGRAFVTVCNLISWDSLTNHQKAEVQKYKENGLHCRR